MEEWAEIRRLHFSEDMGIKAIARELGVARNTVGGGAFAGAAALPAAPRGSAVDAFEDDICRLLRDDPRMPASVIAERVGWTRGMTRGGTSIAPRTASTSAQAGRSTM